MMLVRYIILYSGFLLLTLASPSSSWKIKETCAIRSNLPERLQRICEALDMIMKALHEHEQFPTNNRGIRDTASHETPGLYAGNVKRKGEPSHVFLRFGRSGKV
ncbi:uncharacterized protein LOC111697764 [Eurytemora carolleeae]|uniref:uncharacterized protein LOC111697764 n=1 Tax=Eurytemora carolleeae TaxID=1294199 RepID=UPI000C7872E1|nr:uncharacterized protein LOC111697764 [Eurytemora carolleeae]|eukprot:XP_023323653.1 uncharacterized protein LOC111697764 [Eurytemora affinis]